MRAHYFQHVPFEGLGSIEPWLQQSGYQITSTRFFESPQLPDHHEIDFLVIMGGPMSVNDEEAFPWLAPEKEFVRTMIESGKPVLGVCLGAQLIASALGAPVYQNHIKEIGWFPVEAVAAGDSTLFPFPESATVFHWHGETFDLPPGATCLAKSPACAHQAFQIGTSVMGLQFHLETTPQAAEAITANCRNELIASQYVQTEQEILAATDETYLAINRLMVRVLDYLQKGV